MVTEEEIRKRNSGVEQVSTKKLDMLGNKEQITTDGSASDLANVVQSKLQQVSDNLNLGY